jgi:hypothetical protein
MRKIYLANNQQSPSASIGVFGGKQLFSSSAFSGVCADKRAGIRVRHSIFFDLFGGWRISISNYIDSFLGNPPAVSIFLL